MGILSIAKLSRYSVSTIICKSISLWCLDSVLCLLTIGQFFVECKSTQVERNYFGSVSTTTSGFSCQRWDSQSPHLHNLSDPERFPDVSVEAASNYCRNPDGKVEGPWCFTDDPFVEWEYCDIPVCSGL